MVHNPHERLVLVVHDADVAGAAGQLGMARLTLGREPGSDGERWLGLVAPSGEEVSSPLITHHLVRLFFNDPFYEKKVRQLCHFFLV